MGKCTCFRGVVLSFSCDGIDFTSFTHVFCHMCLARPSLPTIPWDCLMIDLGGTSYQCYLPVLDTAASHPFSHEKNPHLGRSPQ